MSASDGLSVPETAVIGSPRHLGRGGSVDVESQPDKSEKALSVKTDDAVLKGVYATMVRAIVTENECTLDFVYVDPSSVDTEEPQGFLVSRVVVANGHLPAISEMLNRQVAGLEKRGKGATERS